MATGGGGGGYSFKLAECYVDIFAKSGRLARDIAQAQRMLKALGGGGTTTITLKLQGFTKGNAAKIAAIGSAMVSMSRSANIASASIRNSTNAMRSATVAAMALNAAMGKNTAAMAAKIIRAQAAARAMTAPQQIAANAAATGVKAGAQASATGVRATAAALAKARTSAATAAATGTRATASAMATQQTAAARAAATAIRATASALAMQRRTAIAAAVAMGRLAIAGQRAGQATAAGARRGSSALESMARRIGQARRGMIALQYGASRMTGTDLSVGGIMGEAADMEQRMLGLKRVTDLEGKALDDLGDRFKKAAGLTGGRDLASTFKVADIGARMGIGGDSLALFTRDMVKVGAVLDENVIPFEELTTRISRLSSVFKLGSQDAIKIASSLNRLDMSSSANAREILDVTNRMSGMAAVFKLTVTQTMALATALKQANIPTESAGTSMSQLLGRMAETKSRGAFAKIANVGPNYWKKLVTTDALGAVKTLIYGLKQLEERKGPIAVVDALTTLKLDGQRVRGTLLQLGQVIDKVDGYAQAASDDFRTQSSILEGFKVVMESTNKQFELMQNNVRLAAAAVGTGLLPVFKSAFKAIIGLANDVQAAFETNKDAISAWAKGVGDKIEYLGSVFRSWRDHLQLAKLFGMEKAEQGWEILKRLVGQLSAYWSDTWHNMSTYVGNVLGGMAKVLADLGKQLGANLGANIRNGIAGALDGMSPVLKGVIEGVMKLPPGALSMGRAPVPNVAPNMALMGDPHRGQRAVRGLDPGALFGNLPNRRAEINPLLERIRLAKEGMQRERAQAAQLEEMQDAVQREKIRVAGMEQKRVQLEAFREQAALARGKGRKGAVAAFRDFGREAGFGGWELGVPGRMEAIRARNRRKAEARRGPGGKGDARDDAWRLMAPGAGDDPDARKMPALRRLPEHPAMVAARGRLEKIRANRADDRARAAMERFGVLADARENFARFADRSGMPAAQARIAGIGRRRQQVRARRFGRLAVQDPLAMGGGILDGLKGIGAGFAGLGALAPKAKPDPDAKEKKNAGFIGEAVAKATGLGGGKLIEALNKLMAMAAAPPVWN